MNYHKIRKDNKATYICISIYLHLNFNAVARLGDDGGRESRKNVAPRRRRENGDVDRTGSADQRSLRRRRKLGTAPRPLGDAKSPSLLHSFVGFVRMTLYV